ncbi:amino acid ABC transporter permease [Treponema brennaborense]|uniref:Polar amino acid ABC transporter, inner membrane subunit n=1 Tax=Treponema brennaborense (strain DSM 12168 / CIP 105900 / DD5/3) TaxID=906968 RepID=F4LJT6_TREBD|nr:amino acid ABC transporter permease [Treponema brennaborense]AEE16416.1 polar amino acid ABC transporter, inner membrane subunit [Treponema brennaborense DSM 12168]
MEKMLLAMCEGSLVSLKIFFLTLLFSLPLGLPFAAARMSKNPVLSVPAKLFMLIIRGTPLILQLIFVYFAPYYLFKISYNRFTAAIIAMSVNYAAYFAEIYRGGIESVSKGQYEAGKVLGFTRLQTFFRIVLPQVIKRILPATGNEVITLVKDTALAQVIGVAELFRVAQNAASREFSTMPIFVAGVFYFFMNWIVSAVFVRAEKKLDYYR